MRTWSLCLVLLLGIAISSVCATDKLRGVKTSEHNLYQGEFIECDNGKKVPLDRVNDDFCDCEDGKDEPGTSACPRGRFFCVNKGFRGTSIPAAWVDDGRCDCCDGSDESKKQCSNTCEESAKKHLAKVANEIGVQERGLALREAYVTHALNERARRMELIDKAELKVAELDAQVTALEKTKIAAEEAYSAAHDVVQDRVNAELEAKKDKTATETKTETDEDGAKEEEDENEARLGIDEDPVVKPLKEVPTRFLEETGGSYGGGDEDDEEEESFWDQLMIGYADLFDAIRLFVVGMVDSVVPKTEKEKAVIAWSEAKGARDAAQRELDDHRKFTNLDFGTDSAFHALYGNTYEFSDKEYTYKLNTFNDVQQTKPGHSSTLGRWKGWDQHKPNVMIYENGDRCWGAPDRSTKVTLICGDEHKVIDVKEPNKCEYTMTVKTPAACSKATLEALKNGE